MRRAVEFPQTVPRTPSLLRSWDDAPAFLLSCPGPLRRHHAAVQPISQLRLPQCLLGSEAQLLSFCAAQPELAARFFFVPLPEMFASPASISALRDAAGVRGAGGRLVHLRFGGTRSARVLKEARNALVLAEDHRAPPITASRHPFASGLVIPPLIRRVLALQPGLVAPRALGADEPLAMTPAEGDFTGADLRRVRRDGAGAEDGLDILSFAEFRSNAWAAGPVRAGSAHLRAARRAARDDGAPFVLLPWNLDHPGSIVPALVERALRLQTAQRPAVRLIVMPFNYPGQTGLIRRLIRQVRTQIEDGQDALPHLFLARLSRPAALPGLRRLARVAWVDGNDPEHDWTARRLQAAGFAPILLAAHDGARPGTVLMAADDAQTIAAESRFGLLHYHVRLPSLRALRALLPMTKDLALERARPARRPAAEAALAEPA